MTRLALLLALLVAGCGDKRPPAPTAEENERLNAADSMLDGLGNEAGPEKADALPDPGNRSD